MEDGPASPTDASLDGSIGSFSASGGDDDLGINGIPFHESASAFEATADGDVGDIYGPTGEAADEAIGAGGGGGGGEVTHEDIVPFGNVTLADISPGISYSAEDVTEVAATTPLPGTRKDEFDQVDQVAAFDSSLVSGESYYLVCSRWIRNWRQCVQSYGARPGPIDQSSLLIRDYSTGRWQLMASRWDRTDYEIITKGVSFLVSTFFVVLPTKHISKHPWSAALILFAKCIPVGMGFTSSLVRRWPSDISSSLFAPRIN